MGMLPLLDVWTQQAQRAAALFHYTTVVTLRTHIPAHSSRLLHGPQTRHSTIIKAIRNFSTQLNPLLGVRSVILPRSAPAFHNNPNLQALLPSNCLQTVMLQCVVLSA